MNKSRQKLINMIQQASPPGIMGIDAILKAQEEARVAAEIEKQKKENRTDSDPDSDSESDQKSGDNEEEDTTSSSQTTITRGYVPPPELVHTIIPGTKAKPLDMFSYMDRVFEQALDEIGLKESILEALHTIGAAKDSGEDELPTLLDQQLTNMTLLWELEPYVETAPERNQVEERLGVVSWQMENVK
ncbi:hypothetical protein BGZ80_003666 [Entomortierella chlamydospora]|uniref:Uncharacterized protein n=1 Tax=Entomortierella chlamydospora TaxID=101097 RepID=A0A9P6N215_9FUNG|nr:hypothetical protein BGZ79_001241 [Entomortierella chlamydospora]KAG0020733.1 hypothetical protein BGZ80_003666 [Entomortierella chlamydospora]